MCVGVVCVLVLMHIFHLVLVGAEYGLQILPETGGLRGALKGGVPILRGVSLNHCMSGTACTNTVCTQRERERENDHL